jgi:hypothetical protein
MKGLQKNLAYLATVVNHERKMFIKLTTVRTITKYAFLGAATFRIMTLSITIVRLTTFSIMTLSIMTFSIMTFSIMTISIMTISTTIN